MRSSVLWSVSWVVLAFAACSSTTGGATPGDGGSDALVINAQEAHACSTDPADDPQLVCSPSMDLVCIATYSVPVSNPQLAAKFDGGIRQVFVCRYPCSNAGDCPQPGDVCCPGQIFGRTFDRKAACVPASSCEATSAGDAGP